MCDCSILDHWLKWQKFLAEKKSGSQIEEKNNLLKSLYYFWITTYTVIFRIRVNSKELEKRLPASGLHAHDIDQCQQMDALYGQIILADQIHAIDIWNQKSIDESAQEVLKKISELKLL
ncbi:hypothetical protein EH223_09460 [candidate division KSB1 bacterium]|nr:MAG: hypothetical protein EH223_09460 [candidate division KSB1 bacterium]